MKTLQNLCVIALASLSVFAGGCGGSTATVEYYGAKGGVTNFTIATVVAQPSEPWPNATITGWAVPSTSNCDPSTDSNCVMVIGLGFPDAIYENGITSFSTNSSGAADFGTDAFGAEWNFYATDNGSSQCPNGSASVTVSGEGPVKLICGQNYAEMVATPSSCLVNQNSGLDTCPATVTLAFPPPIASSRTLPVAAALTATNYDNSGDNLAQASVTASTATSVAVRTPATAGTTYLVIQDTSGNVLGAAEFTRTVVVLTCPSSTASLSALAPEIVPKCPPSSVPTN